MIVIKALFYLVAAVFTVLDALVIWYFVRILARGGWRR